MRTVAVGFALIVLASAAGAQPREPYTSDHGKYSIKFPGEPKVTEQSAKGGKDAKKEVTVYIATYALNDGSIYMVSYSDLATGVDKDKQAKFFDAIRDGVKGTDGRVLTETELLAGKVGEERWPGREYTVEKFPQRIRLRVVLRENRLYQVAVIGTAAFVNGKDAEAFLYSLELTKLQEK